MKENRHDIIIINDIFCCSFKLIVIEIALAVAIMLEEEEEGDAKEGVVFSSAVELLFIKEMTSINRVHFVNKIKI